MNTLQILPLPESNIAPELIIMYFRSGQNKSISYDSGKIFLENDDIVSFSTYFGAFSLSTWSNIAKIDNVIVCLNIVGKASVRILHIDPDGSSNILSELETNVGTDSFSFGSTWIEISLKDLSKKEGILFPEVVASDDGVVISGLKYATSDPPKSSVKLAIIMTTFKREAYVLKNMKKIASFFSNSSEFIELFIIDNGQTIGSESPSKKIHIIPNKNFGGSGGFTRGLLEAMDSPFHFSHFLFCDDDIELETESLRTTYKLLEYLPDGSVVGGAMLSMVNTVKKPEVYEIGEWMDPITGRFEKNKGNIFGDMQFYCEKIKDLIQHDATRNINYFGWWFFSFSRDLVNKVGLPLPLFVRADDVEFGFRCKNKGFNFVSLLGVGVWHEDFTKKRMGLVMDFYGMRNKRIITLLHSKKSNEFYILSSTFINIIKSLLLLRYKKALMQMMVFSEVIKGPERLMSVFREAWEFHAYLGKSLGLEIVDSEFLSPEKKKFSFLTKILSLFTLNGHLLPEKFIKNNKEPIILDFDHTRIYDSFRMQNVIYRDPFTNKGYSCHHNKNVFFSILFQSIVLFIKGIILLPFLRKRYQKAFPVMTGEAYWRDVFKKTL